jgi:hypothetical protein
MTLTDNLNLISFDWARLILWAVEIGYAAFLLRPSKCKEIVASFEAERSAINNR